MIAAFTFFILHSLGAALQLELVACLWLLIDCLDHGHVAYTCYSVAYTCHSVADACHSVAYTCHSGCLDRLLLRYHDLCRLLSKNALILWPLIDH